MRINHSPKLGIIQEVLQTFNEKIKNKKMVTTVYGKTKALCFSTIHIGSIHGSMQVS